MRPLTNYKNTAPTANIGRLAPGGYVVRITEVIDHDDKEYLEIRYDITDGPEAGRFADPFYADKPYAHRFSRFYSDRSMGDFRAFIQMIDTCNGTKFDAELESGKGFREQKLVGKLIGIILSEEEYRTNRGDVKSKLEVYKVLEVEKIVKGEFTVPDLKPLKEEPTAGMKPAPEVSFPDLTDEDIPF